MVKLEHADDIRSQKLCDLVVIGSDTLGYPHFLCSNFCTVYFSYWTQYNGQSVGQVALWRHRKSEHSSQVFNCESCDFSSVFYFKLKVVFFRSIECIFYIIFKAFFFVYILWCQTGSSPLLYGVYTL